jgi:alginate O-acetyltransferase complex protein AlgJ
MLEQSAGVMRRDGEIAHTADLLMILNGILIERTAKLIVAVPPNSATIYSDKLPPWARSESGPTEYDLLLKALAVRRVRAVDLRPALLAARHHGNTYYQHDTHWTGRGALAAFNAIATALGRPSWRLDPATALGPERPRFGGDLARMLRVEKESVELDQPLALPLGDYHPISAVNGPGGLDAVYLGSAQMSPASTVMILGDSFTQGYFAPMILANGSGVVWEHHKLCNFDWHLLDEYRPDEVWYMPTERYLTCPLDSHPKGMPAKIWVSP